MEKLERILSAEESAARLIAEARDTAAQHIADARASAIEAVAAARVEACVRADRFDETIRAAAVDSAAAIVDAAHQQAAAVGKRAESRFEIAVDAVIERVAG